MNYHFFLPKEPALNTHFFLAMDAEWDENKHPRADNGQFGKGGGGMPSHAATQKPTQVSSTLTGVFTKAGFKKQKQPGPNNTVVYFHPESGAKVSVHPAPEGKKWSSKWTHAHEGKETQGEGSNLEKLLAGAIAKAQAAKPAPTPAAAPALSDNTQAAASFMKEKGYKVEKQSGTEVLFNTPAGAKVLMDMKSGDWIAQTPGHMTKEGKGLEALQSLMSGKIAPGVKNTNKTAAIVTQADKEAAEQAAKELKEKQAKAAAAQAKAMATFEAYKAAAPAANSAQQSAIVSYCNNGYVSINNYLRQDSGGNPTVKANIEKIDAYLKTATFPEDGVVYRGVKGNFAVHLKSVLMKGTKFADYGFVSTSAFEHSAFGGHLRMKINVKKGQRGAAVAQISHHPGENEILLPRESIFEVISYNRKTGEVEVNLVQDHFDE